MAISPEPAATGKPAGRLYGGLSPEQRRAERRRRLLAAALQRFGTGGFATTTIPQICAEAAVTARHFYEEYGSREALLRAVYDEICDEAYAAMQGEMFGKYDDPVQIARASTAAYFEALARDPRKARVTLVEIVGVNDDLERHRHTTRERFVALTTKSSSRLDKMGVPRTIDYELVARALYGATDALLLERLMSGRPSFEQIVEHITTMWIRTLQLDEVAALRALSR